MRLSVLITPVCLLAAAATLFPVPLAAGPIAVLNPGFELDAAGIPLPSGPGLAAYSTSIQPYGWTVSVGDIEFVGSGYAGWWAVQEGSYSVDLNGGQQGGIWQEVGGLTPGAAYNLVFALSANAAWRSAGAPCSLRVTIGGDPHDYAAGGAPMTFSEITIPFVTVAASVTIAFDSLATGPAGP